MANKNISVRQVIEDSLTECLRCIQPSLPHYLFGVECVGNQYVVRCACYSFHIPAQRSIFALAIKRLVISQFSTFLPFVRREFMRQAPGHRAVRAPDWQFNAHPFLVHAHEKLGVLEPCLQRLSTLNEEELQPRLFKFKVAGGRALLRCQVYCGFITASLEFPDGLTFKFPPAGCRLLLRSSLPGIHITNINARSENSPMRLKDVVDLGSLSGFDGKIVAAENTDKVSVLTVEGGRQTLAPTPAAAMALAPKGCNPAAPWDMTQSEIEALKSLAK